MYVSLQQMHFSTTMQMKEQSSFFSAAERANKRLFTTVKLYESLGEALICGSTTSLAEARSQIEWVASKTFSSQVHTEANLQNIFSPVFHSL